MTALLETLPPSATSLIRKDHAHVMVVFHRYRPDASAAIKKALAETICTALEIHARIEEEIFYPAIRALMPDNGVVLKSVPEHDEMRRLIGEIRNGQPGTRNFDDAVCDLMRAVIHHVADEETVLLPVADRTLGDRLDELDARMARRKLQLAGPRMGSMVVNRVRAMPPTTLLMLAAAIGLGLLLARDVQQPESRRAVRSPNSFAQAGRRRRRIQSDSSSSTGWWSDARVSVLTSTCDTRADRSSLTKMKSQVIGSGP